MTVQILGIRHHSPACARLVEQIILEKKPAAVLIEGPSDFNSRIDELLLGHRLPIALYSYANEGARPAQCWFPFLDFSPEWLALRHGRASDATLRFIDLPHWQYRTLPERSDSDNGSAPQRSRYGESVARLCRQFGCDSDSALWDHVFESASGQDLQDRLDLYFHELRGDDRGTPQDQAREQYMAQWVAWAERQQVEKKGEGRNLVLVICGGWHKRAIENLWPEIENPREPESVAPTDPQKAGSYLVPFEYRQVDAMGGYRAGMQSPLYYQWAWEHGLQAAGLHAVQAIVTRLRGKGIIVSTADLVALETMQQGLCKVRGHAEPLRGDILDALQSAVVKEALETAPPWVAEGLLHAQHHPVLREALLALTGEGGGELHTDTPMPPLLHDVNRQLKECAISVTRSVQALVLDRRRDTDGRSAQVLWKLKLLGIEGVRLHEMRAPNAARSLKVELQYEEHWQLVANDHWLPNLIEAAVYGATLETAARNCLLEQVSQATGDAAAFAACMLHAMRAGLYELGADLAQRLEDDIATMHDHVALAKAAHVLLEVAQAGFWGTDTRPLFERVLSVVSHHLLWLIESRQGDQVEYINGDVQAVQAFHRLLKIDCARFNRMQTLDVLSRIYPAPDKPAALRGAALAVCYLHDMLIPDSAARLLAAIQAIPPRDALGDFLYGLFSCARATAVESDGIVQAVHAALESMSGEEFLVALPQLRAAFSWFPPRERGSIAAMVASMLGLSGTEQRLLLQRGAESLPDAKRIEAQALVWAREIGVLP